LDKKRVEEEYCEGCKTKELRESVGGLVERLIKSGNAADVGRLSKTKTAQQQPAALRQKQESEGVWIEPNTGMKFRRIPGGSFRMGSPSSEKGRSGNWLSNSDETPHTVSVGKFWLGEMEVTNRQYRLFKPGHDSGSYKEHSLNGADQPVVKVSWHNAVAYAQWLSQKTGKRFRLPTEAEWEYAARAGTTTAYYWGEGIGNNNANCDGCGSRWDDKQTAPVGSFKPNAFGLFDMLGNVYEWTCSEYKASYDGSEQKCAVSASKYPLRGGSWNYGPGGGVRRTASTPTRVTAATTSDFVLPRTNPLPFSKDPCVG
jgi:formylglycine-generating enzyme required for sulfatase activity